MKRSTSVLAVIGSLALASIGSSNAAPMTPVEQSDYDSRQIHEMRDVKTGDYRPHGTLSGSERDFTPRQDIRQVPPMRYNAPDPSLRLHLPE